MYLVDVVHPTTLHWSADGPTILLEGPLWQGWSRSIDPSGSTALCMEGIIAARACAPAAVVRSVENSLRLDIAVGRGRGTQWATDHKGIQEESAWRG